MMIQRDDVVLVVVDFQTALLPKIPVGDDIMGRAVKLIRFARQLSLPILWTEQYRKGLGPTHEKIAKALRGAKPLEKVSFGCFGAQGFAEALEETGRRQLLITGIEAHVCVMQTALAALANGYGVFIPRDAVASRNKSDYKAGLARMQASGAQLVTTEMAMFEILRAAGTPEFRKILPLLR